MKRRAIEGGGWFDIEAAQNFAGDSYWDGSNHIQVSTGSQWSGQDLYRTKGGNWVLYHWSNVQGSASYYERVSATEAAEWLARNEHEPPPELAEAHAALEV